MFYVFCFVSFPVLFVCICVLYYCHRVATQLQLNISYIISYHHKNIACLNRYMFQATKYVMSPLGLKRVVIIKTVMIL